MDFTGPNVEINAVERDGRIEPLADAVRSYRRRVHAHILCGIGRSATGWSCRPDGRSRPRHIPQVPADRRDGAVARVVSRHGPAKTGVHARTMWRITSFR